MMRKRSGSRPPRREPKEIFRTNRNITAREVRLIGGDGELIGLKNRAEALHLAEEVGLDLVEISPNTTPPVCKIIDYGKFLFQREKKKKEAKKNQHIVHLKEIKMRPKTDVHDYNFKVKHIREFLANGDKVKVTVRFKGREMSFVDLGHRQINRVAEDIGEACKVEFAPKMEGRTLFMILAPGKQTVAKIAAERAAELAKNNESKVQTVGKREAAGSTIAAIKAQNDIDQENSKG